MLSNSHAKNLNTDLKPFPKINLKRIRDLNVKYKITNSRRKPKDFGYAMTFWI